MTPSHTAYVGSRTAAARGASGDGLTVWSTTTPEWTLQQTVRLDDPTWLHVDAPRRRLWAGQGDGDTVTTLAVASDGALHDSVSLSVGGSNIVHVMPSPDGQFLLTANHNSSTVSLLALTADGTPEDLLHVLEVHGEAGTHKQQGDPRPHQIVFDPSGRWVLVPDKATDRIHVLAIDTASRRLRTVGAIRTKTGSAPRHLAFDDSGTWFATADEFGNSVSVCRFDPTSGSGHQIQGVQASDDTDVRDSRGSGILHHRGMIYVSNRIGKDEHSPVIPGDDSVSVFRVRPSGLLTRVETRSTPGCRPRFIGFTPARDGIAVAHERTHSIAVHPIGPSGTLGQGRIVARTGSPTAVQFLA